MASKRRHPLHAGIAPHADVVLRVPVGTHELVDVFRKQEIADLAFRLDSMEGLQLVGIPKSDGPVLGTASASQESLLMRGPGDSFNGGFVLVEDHLWLVVVMCAPHHQFVIITS